MVEAVTHGQELESEFLDTLFKSIQDSVPDRQWVEIKKNHDQVIAGIKHIIDSDCYGANFEIVFNNSYTHFKKREGQQVQNVIFSNKYVSDFSQEFWKAQDELALKQMRETIEKMRKKEESKLNKKRRGSKR